MKPLFTFAHKNGRKLHSKQVYICFNRKDLNIYQSADVISYLKSKSWANDVLLMMSSGNFDGVDFKELAGSLTL